MIGAGSFGRLFSLDFGCWRFSAVCWLEAAFHQGKGTRRGTFSVKFLSKYIPMTQGFHGQHFIVRVGSGLS